MILMICFARSGGTLLNRCLASLPNVVMMSEVSPLGGGGGLKNLHWIKDQAKEWYGIELKSDERDFNSIALELNEICKSQGKQLIIREWTYINFIPDGPNQFNPPMRHLALEALKCPSFAFVRDAIDVWLSFKRVYPNAGMDDFFRRYLSYVKSLKGSEKDNFKGIMYLKYGLLVTRPTFFMEFLCNHFQWLRCNLLYSPSYKNFHSFTKVNGDIQFGRFSRGFGKDIKQLPRRRIPSEEITLINQCPEMIEANRLLGYPTTY